MNKAEIATVERLRREGKGLSAIAKETGISINTIKSHFSRHGISAPRHARTCLLCTAEIKTTDHFCSDACRAGWYESHSSNEQDILRLCKTCGKPFEPRQPKQVYCSKQCFYEKASAKHDKLEAEVARRKNKARQIAAFIDQLEKAPASLEEWDCQVWSLLLEKGTVNRDGSITFEFRNGKEIKVEAK